MRNFKSLIIYFIVTISSSISAQQLPELWMKEFKAQGKCSDRIRKIESDNAGNVYAFGYACRDRSVADIFLMKRNAQGDTLWQYYYDSGEKGIDYGIDFTLDTAGNSYITGTSQRTLAGIIDCITIKVNNAGIEQWASRYPTAASDDSYGNAIAVDTSGNVYVAGRIEYFSSSDDWLVIKYNSSGVQLWTDVHNGPGNGYDEALDIIVAPNGNATACGYAQSSNLNGARNALVKQYNSSGGVVWTDTYTNPNLQSDDLLRGMGYSTNGYLFVGGHTNNINNNRDAFAICYNSNGVRQWTTIYHDSTGIVQETIASVVIDTVGNIYFGGASLYRGCITKVNSDGSIGWRRTWIGEMPSGYDILNSIAIDDSGGVYAAGRGVYQGPNYYFNGGLANMIITKYSAEGDSLWTYRILDSSDVSMGFAISIRNGVVYTGGFKTDTANVDENLQILIVDSAGNGLHEWNHNGQGQGITRGQFVRTDAFDNVYSAATCDRMYNEGRDVVIVKYDPAGNLLWEKYYSSPAWNNDTLTGMEINPAGELILSISSDSVKLSNNYKLSLVKMDSNGNFLDTAWYLPYPLGSTLAKSMFVRSDGSIVIGANSSISGGLLLFFNDQFSFQWAAKVDSTPSAVTRISSVAAFPNGDIAVGGFVQTGSSNTAKGVVQKFSVNGNMLWTTDFDSLNEYDEIFDVTVSNAGEVAAIGITGYLSVGFSALITYNGVTGLQQWRSVYNPGTSSEYGVQVRYTPAGNIAYICKGWTSFNWRYTTVQYSAIGSFQWATVFSQVSNNRVPLKLIVEPNNRIVTAGYATNGSALNIDFVLVGYNSFGNQYFFNGYTTPSNYFDRLADLIRDSQGNLIVVGESGNDSLMRYLYKMITIKYGTSTVGMEEINTSNNVIAYPNPSNGTFLLVEKSAGSPIINGNVYDLQGRKVTTLDLINREINLSKFPSGLYILQYQRENGSLGSLKLVLSPRSY